MKITIEFDFTQKDLMGKQKMLDVQDGTILLDFLKSVDILIENACSKKERNAGSLKVLSSSTSLNSCIVSVNGEPPSGLLEHILKDGDTVSLLYGYCGG